MLHVWGDPLKYRDLETKLAVERFNCAIVLCDAAWVDPDQVRHRSCLCIDAAQACLHPDCALCLPMRSCQGDVCRAVVLGAEIASLAMSCPADCTEIYSCPKPSSYSACKRCDLPCYDVQNAANGIALRTRDDMLRLDSMIMSVQLGIRKLLEVHISLFSPQQHAPLLFPYRPLPAACITISFPYLRSGGSH